MVVLEILKEQQIPVGQVVSIAWIGGLMLGICIYAWTTKDYKKNSKNRATIYRDEKRN